LMTVYMKRTRNVQFLYLYVGGLSCGLMKCSMLKVKRGFSSLASQHVHILLSEI